jgi:hypothetical protein
MPPGAVRPSEGGNDQRRSILRVSSALVNTTRASFLRDRQRPKGEIRTLVVVPNEIRIEGEPDPSVAMGSGAASAMNGGLGFALGPGCGVGAVGCFLAQLLTSIPRDSTRARGIARARWTMASSSLRPACRNGAIVVGWRVGCKKDQSSDVKSALELRGMVDDLQRPNWYGKPVELGELFILKKNRGEAT